MVCDDAVIDWLLDSDPALPWQVERDLVDAPRNVWGATRARIAAEGSGHACSRRRILTANGRFDGRDELV